MVKFFLESENTHNPQGWIWTTLRRGAPGAKAGRQNRNSWEDLTILVQSVSMGFFVWEGDLACIACSCLGVWDMSLEKLDIMRLNLEAILIGM